MEITKAQAAAFHRQKTYQEGTMVIWAVFTRNKDLDDKYSARPIVVPNSKPRDEDGYLIAESLGQIRGMIPQGLSRLDRHPGDEHGVIEKWFHKSVD